MRTNLPGAAKLAVPLHLGGVAAALALSPLLPPDRGAVLLLPVAPGAEASMVRDAIDAGALLMGRGPIAASVVVRADGPDFAWRMVRAGVLPLAGRAVGCGGRGERRA